MFDGNVLKELRLKNNLNQIDLANILGVTQKNVSSYETNRTRPDYESLIKMADYFNVSVDYLLGRNKEKLDSLSDNEKYLIDIFRSFKREHQIEVLNIMKFLDKLGD